MLRESKRRAWETTGQRDTTQLSLKYFRNRSGVTHIMHAPKGGAGRAALIAQSP
jgi:hypothetical protein